MSSNDSAVRSALDHETIRSASKLLIAAIALIGVLALVTLLPGVDRLVPLAPVTFAAVATAVVSVAVSGILLYAAPKFALLTRTALGGSVTDADDGPDRIVENAAGMVYWLVVFAAVLVAYRGLGAAAMPLLGDAAWVYDAGFLFVALVPVVFLVTRLTLTVDPLAELVADRVTGGSVDDDSDDDSEESVGGDDDSDSDTGS
ncbi:hypothetical protein GJ633_10290 [Halorubrum sp. CBA1125]|uniref:hypothetical protein n=1 Tax=Halorubrum sp. CBA1125 TaxID=2668072 RepID=UPI0012E789A0|nr:hypothetical protein [Halorubrum sp. CBA1125]MUW15007.1 hypothetical protein [Halorubrum sp. CBA1125]